MIVLFIWLIKREDGYFFLASILTALTIWSRSDAIVFFGAGFIILLYDRYKNKSWRKLIIYSVFCLVSFFAWNLYLKFNVNVDQNVFISAPFWDGDKLVNVVEWVKNLLFNQNLFGITFFVLFIMIIINIKNLKLDNSTLLLLLLVISWAMYTFLFYQMDNSKTDSLNKMMEASYRRGLFSFVPIVWAYVAFNEQVLKIFSRLDEFLGGTTNINSKKSKK
jgi:hypothetical protein